MELAEKVEPYILNYIIDNFTSLDLDFSHLQALKKYKNKMKNNQVVISYKDSGASAEGRIYAKSPSLQNFPKRIRNTLAHKNYIDIDLNNCSFNIISNYCKLNNLINDNLNDYIQNREERLKELGDKRNITRNEAKEYMNIVMNTEKPKGEEFIWIKKIRSEINGFVNHIKNTDKQFIKEVKLIRKNKNKTNSEYGSIVSYYYQSIEKKIIKEAISYLESHSYKIDCIIHDGFLIRNKKIENLDITLKNLNEHIFKTLNFNIMFCKKEMKERLNIPKDILEMDDIKFHSKDEIEYNKLKELFEKDNFFISNPTCYLNFDCDGVLHITKLNDIKKKFIDWKPAGTQKFFTYIDTDKPKTFIENYERDPYKKKYNKYKSYFDRSKCPNNVFNTFRGFDYEEYYLSNEFRDFNDEDYKGLQTIKDFYKYLLDDNSGNSEEYMNFLMQYFAHLIFNPMEKTKIVIIIKSLEGCGKNVGFEFLGELLGYEFYLDTSNPKEDIFGDFNSLREKKKIIIFNEADPEQSKYFYEQLKDATTNEKIIVKQKYFDSKLVDDYAEISATTNNEIPFKISSSNRRFVLFECRQNKKDRKYFGELWFNKNSIMKNKKVKILFLDYLKSIYKDDFDFSNFPKTKFYNRSLNYCKNNFDEYLKYIIPRIEANTDSKFRTNRGITTILQSNFFNSYKDFCLENSLPNNITLKGFKLKLEEKELFNFKATNKGRGIYFDIDKCVTYLKEIGEYEEIDFLLSNSEYETDEE